MVASFVAGLEVYFARVIAEIHERESKPSTTYPFMCLIFQLCRDAGVQFSHYDTLRQPLGQLI